MAVLRIRIFELVCPDGAERDEACWKMSVGMTFHGATQRDAHDLANRIAEVDAYLAAALEEDGGEFEGKKLRSAIRWIE